MFSQRGYHGRSLVGLALTLHRMGETREDRCDLAFALREVGANVVPINILNPIEGTPFAKNTPLPPLEIA